MKHLIIALILAITPFLIHAQVDEVTPGALASFHAIDKDGKPLRNALLEVTFTFATKDEDGNPTDVYSEKFQVTTNTNGNAQREIGATTGDLPTVLYGKFKDVDFTDPDLCVKMDYREIGTFIPETQGEWQRVVPVPAAVNAMNGSDSNDEDKDATNELQIIEKQGNTITLSDEGGTVELNDDDPTNELQALSYDPDTKTLTLVGGGTVDLSGISPWQTQGNVLCTQRIVEAQQLRTKDGRTDIEGGKISMRYASGSDGIEMGVDEEGYPFITFMNEDSDILAEIRMGPEGFMLYKND